MDIAGNWLTNTIQFFFMLPFVMTHTLSLWASPMHFVSQIGKSSKWYTLFLWKYGPQMQILCGRFEITQNHIGFFTGVKWEH